MPPMTTIVISYKYHKPSWNWSYWHQLSINKRQFHQNHHFYVSDLILFLWFSYGFHHFPMIFPWFFHRWGGLGIWHLARWPKTSSECQPLSSWSARSRRWPPEWPSNKNHRRGALGEGFRAWTICVCILLLAHSSYSRCDIMWYEYL